MKIYVTHDELVIAVIGYIQSIGVSLDNKDVAVEFTAGRKGNGFTADVEITTRAITHTPVKSSGVPTLDEVEEDTEPEEVSKPSVRLFGA